MAAASTRTGRKAQKLPSRPAPRLVWLDDVCVGRDGREVGRVLHTGLRWIARMRGRDGCCDLVLDDRDEARQAVERSAARRKGEAP